MLDSFVRRVGAMSANDMTSWLVVGLMSCDQGREPASAFVHAGGSFGQTSRDWQAPDELVALFRALDRDAQRRFHEAVARAIDVVEATQVNAGVLRNLAEVGLLTRCNDALLVLAEKIRLPSPEVRAVIYGLSGFYLAERDAPVGIKTLALQILRNADFPDSLCLQLLVAMARYSPEGLVTYAPTLEPILQRVLLSKEDWPRGYGRFQAHFADAVLRDQAVERLLPRLLASHLYASLLLPNLESVGPGLVRAKLDPPLPAVVRVPPTGLAGKARRHLFPGATTSVRHSQDLFERATE
jgi:hypothetical protein